MSVKSLGGQVPIENGQFLFQVLVKLFFLQDIHLKVAWVGLRMTVPLVPSIMTGIPSRICEVAVSSPTTAGNAHGTGQNSGVSRAAPHIGDKPDNPVFVHLHGIGR
jgi:hypothetical protein